MNIVQKNCDIQSEVAKELAEFYGRPKRHDWVNCIAQAKGNTLTAMELFAGRYPSDRVVQRTLREAVARQLYAMKVADIYAWATHNDHMLALKTRMAYECPATGYKAKPGKTFRLGGQDGGLWLVGATGRLEYEAAIRLSPESLLSPATWEIVL